MPNLQIDKALTVGERRAVLDEADRRLVSGNGEWRSGLVVWFAIGTGARVGEMVRVVWGDVDLERRTCRIHRLKRRGRDDRDHVQLPGVLVERLRACGGTFGGLFGGVSKRTLQSDWGEVLGAVGVEDRGIHAARHTKGTMMAEAGKGPYTIARQLGHRDLSMSLQYVHLNAEAMQDATDAGFEGY